MGSSNSSLSKTRTCLFYIINIMAADVLVMQGARASAVNSVLARWGLVIGATGRTSITRRISVFIDSNNYAVYIIVLYSFNTEKCMLRFRWERNHGTLCWHIYIDMQSTFDVISITWYSTQLGDHKEYKLDLVIAKETTCLTGKICNTDCCSVEKTTKISRVNCITFII